MDGMTRAPLSNTQNPLFADLDRLVRAAAVRAIEPGHFRPAFDRALAAHRAEIDAIAADPAVPASPTPSARWRRAAASSIVSQMYSLLLAGADTGRALEAVEREVSPLLARHQNACISIARSMPASPTFTAAATLWASTPSRRACSSVITPVSCAPAPRWRSRRRTRLAAINERLATLGTQFGQNVLADEKSIALILEESDLAGLPDFARAAARAAAEERGQPGKYAITLARSSSRPSCNFRPAVTCAKRYSRPGSGAAKTAGRPTTAR